MMKHRFVSASLLFALFCFLINLQHGYFFIFQPSSIRKPFTASSLPSYNIQQSWSKENTPSSPSFLLSDESDNGTSDVTILTLDNFSFQVLSEYDLNNAADLVAQAHFEPHTAPPSLNALAPVLHPFYHLWNQFLLMHLTNKIKAGFHYRARDRLVQPHIGHSEDSMIIIARHMNTGDIAGIVEAYPSNPSYVCNLSVDSKYRRQGLGKLLCQIVEDFLAIQWRIDSIYLHVDQSNDVARKLYESLNYQVSDNPIIYKTEQNLYFPKRVYVEYVKRLTKPGDSSGSDAAMEINEYDDNIVAAPLPTILSQSLLSQIGSKEG